MSKLVLYSKLKPQINLDEMDKINKKLIDMINNYNPQIGYIASESDSDRSYFNKTKEFYNKLGINLVHYFDLDKEYNEENEKWLFNCDVIHLSSGNTYRFLSNLKKRNMISKLIKYSNHGGILVGVSAGMHIMCNKISSAQFGDENDINIQDLTGLGLIDFEVIPHFNKKKNIIEDIKKYSKENYITIYTVEDGNGIIIEDNSILYFGNIGKIENDKYSNILK